MIVCGKSVISDLTGRLSTRRLDLCYTGLTILNKSMGLLIGVGRYWSPFFRMATEEDRSDLFRQTVNVFTDTSRNIPGRSSENELAMPFQPLLHFSLLEY